MLDIWRYAYGPDCVVFCRCLVEIILPISSKVTPLNLGQLYTYTSTAKYMYVMYPQSKLHNKELYAYAMGYIGYT